MERTENTVLDNALFLFRVYEIQGWTNEGV